LSLISWMPYKSYMVSKLKLSYSIQDNNVYYNNNTIVYNTIVYNTIVYTVHSILTNYVTEIVSLSMIVPFTIFLIILL